MNRSKPKLLYVVNSLNPGGTEKLVVEMSLSLAAQYQIEIVCLDEPGLWAIALRAKGIPVYCFWRQPGLDLSIPLKLARHCRTTGAAIIHAHQCTPWFYSALTRLLYPKVKVLLQEHGRFYPEADKPLRRLVNRLIVVPLTARFIAVSTDIRSRLVSFEGIPGSRIDVVYNGIAPDSALTPEERSVARTEFGFSDDDFVVGTTGRLDPIKNYSMLLKALALVCRDAKRVQGLVIGAGQESDLLNRLVDEYGLKGRVQMGGYRADARKLVQCMDLFVLTSLSEGISMALLEAMAAKVPVAVTRVGGNTEVVRDGETGWLVGSGADAELSAVILAALNTPAKGTKMAKEAQAEVASRFTYAQMLKSYCECYEAMLGT